MTEKTQLTHQPKSDDMCQPLGIYTANIHILHVLPSPPVDHPNLNTAKNTRQKCFNVDW